MASEQTDRWLGRVFNPGDQAGQVGNYDAWSDSYDADIMRVGYLTPTLVTGLLARHVPQDGGAILDAGCGTGIAGEMLALFGYPTLVGVDMSDGMLARARQRGVYAELRNRVLGQPLDFADASFAASLASGVFNPGHAPPAALDELIRVTRPGGHVAFNIGEQAWSGCGFAEKIAELTAQRRWTERERTRAYRSMPLSASEGHFTAQVFVFEIV